MLSSSIVWALTQLACLLFSFFPSIISLEWISALSLGRGLDQRHGFGFLRFDHEIALYSSVFSAFRVGSRFCMLCFHFCIHRSYFATVLGYEPSYTVVGPLALTHLSGEWAAEVRIRSPQSNRLWLSMVRCGEARTWLYTTMMTSHGDITMMSPLFFLRRHQGSKTYFSWGVVKRL